MHHDPVRWHDVTHQRSVSAESLPFDQFWRTWFDCQPSYQHRPWRKACPSKSLTWSLLSQSQSLLLEVWTCSCHSKRPRQSERFARKFKTQSIGSVLKRELNKLQGFGIPSDKRNFDLQERGWVCPHNFLEKSRAKQTTWYYFPKSKNLC